MKHENFADLLFTSEKKDWIYDVINLRFINKKDIRISIKEDEEERDYDEEIYDQNWVNNYPNAKTCRRRDFFCQFNGISILKFEMIAVDDWNQYIPKPVTDDLIITHEQFKIGQIVNIPHNKLHDETGLVEQFQKYLSTANIKIK